MSLLGCIKVRQNYCGITKLEAAWLTCKWVNSADSGHLHLCCQLDGGFVWVVQDFNYPRLVPKENKHRKSEHWN